MRLWGFVVLTSGAAIGALTVAACRESADIGQSTARLITPEIPDGSFLATTSSFPAQMATGAFANARSLVLGFDTGTASGGTYGWAVSSDFGVTFDRQCAFDGTNLSGGLPCTAVPIPVNPRVDKLPDGGANWSFGGNPTVVADGLGNIAFIGLGGVGNGQNGTDLIGVSVSQNGGVSFDSTTLVNDVACNNGIQDQPSAVFDYTTSPPTLWIAWRHSQQELGVEGIAGACIRRGMIVKNGGIASVQWLDVPRTIDGLGGIYQYGVAVAAGDGVVTVMYAAGTVWLPGAGLLNSHPLELCPDNGSLFSVDFATVDTFDNGQHWVDNARIFHTSTFQWCVIGGSPGVPGQGTVLTNLRPFGFVRAPGGIEYAVIQDSRNSLRVFMSPAAGIKGYEAPTTTVRPWFEWCPGTPTSALGDAGPTWNWKSTGVGMSNGAPCSAVAVASDPTDAGLDLVLPTIASDGRGNIALGDMEQITVGLDAGIGGAGPPLSPSTTRSAASRILSNRPRTCKVPRSSARPRSRYSRIRRTRSPHDRTATTETLSCGRAARSRR